MEELNHYEGQTYQGMLHGKGKLIGSKGQVLEGTFVKGKPEGEATFTHPDGRVYQFSFKEGRLVGKKLLKGEKKLKKRLNPFREQPKQKPKPKGGGFFLP